MKSNYLISLDNFFYLIEFCRPKYYDSYIPVHIFRDSEKGLITSPICTIRILNNHITNIVPRKMISDDTYMIEPICVKSLLHLCTVKDIQILEYIEMLNNVSNTIYYNIEHKFLNKQKSECTDDKITYIYPYTKLLTIYNNLINGIYEKTTVHTKRSFSIPCCTI